MIGGPRLVITVGAALLSAMAILVAVYFVEKTPGAVFSGQVISSVKRPS